MTDILICGMDKPHNCFQCDLSYLRGERLFCHVTKDEVLRSKIASDCPIQELPEHGDLIDRDANVAVIKKVMKASEGIERHMAEATLKVLNAAPVVLPSNKEEAE